MYGCFTFFSYFAAFYGDSSYYSGRLLVGVFFNKVEDFAGGAF